MDCRPGAGSSDVTAVAVAVRSSWCRDGAANAQNPCWFTYKLYVLWFMGFSVIASWDPHVMHMRAHQANNQLPLWISSVNIIRNSNEGVLLKAGLCQALDKCSHHRDKHSCFESVHGSKLVFSVDVIFGMTDLVVDVETSDHICSEDLQSIMVVFLEGVVGSR